MRLNQLQSLQTKTFQVINYMPNIGPLVCSSIDRDCVKEKPYLFTKNCEGTWRNTGFSAGKEFCCHNGVETKCRLGAMSQKQQQQQQPSSFLSNYNISKLINGMCCMWDYCIVNWLQIYSINHHKENLCRKSSSDLLTEQLIWHQEYWIWLVETNFLYIKCIFSIFVYLHNSLLCIIYNI